VYDIQICIRIEDTLFFAFAMLDPLFYNLMSFLYSTTSKTTLKKLELLFSRNIILSGSQKSQKIIKLIPQKIKWKRSSYYRALLN